jgi:hypothetical protein
MRSMLASGSTSSTTELLRRTIELTEADSERQLPRCSAHGRCSSPVWPTTESGPRPIHGLTCVAIG